LCAYVPSFLFFPLKKISIDDLDSFPLYFSLIQFREIIEACQVRPEAPNLHLHLLLPLPFTIQSAAELRTGECPQAVAPRRVTGGGGGAL